MPENMLCEESDFIENFQNSYKEEEENTITQNFTNIYLMNTAQMYLNLEAELLTPALTIQYLVDATEKNSNLRMNVIKNYLQHQLSMVELSDIQIKSSIESAFNKDPFLSSHSLLKSNFKRKNFYKKHFMYVDPIKVSLGKINGKERFFHYVRIHDTIKAMFQDK